MDPKVVFGILIYSSSVFHVRGNVEDFGIRETGTPHPYPQATETLSRQLLYVDCKESDVIEGVKLGSIIDYVMDKVGIQAGRTHLNMLQQNAQSKFQRYSELLGQKLGGYEPRMQTLRTTIEGTFVQVKIEEFLILLFPEPTVAVTQLVKIVASSILQILRTTKGRSQAETLSHFVLFRIQRSSENIEIVLSVFKVTEKREVSSSSLGSLGSFKQESVTLEESKEERKFVLDKFAIKQITRKLNNE